MNVSSLAGSYISEINARVSDRFSEISGRTGIRFPDVFSRAMTGSGSVGGSSSGDYASEAAGAADSVSGSGGVTVAQASAMLAQAALNGSSSDEIGSLSEQLMSAYNARLARQNLEASVAKTNAAAHDPELPGGITPEKYDNLITEIAAQYGISPLLVRAVAYNESGFNSDAVSASGAVGLMQLMPSTIQSLGVQNPLDPGENIDGGVRCLMGHIIRYGGDIRMALAAYNCGAGTLADRGIKDLNDPDQFALLPAETRSYLEKIEEYLKQYGSGGLTAVNFFTGEALSA